MFDETTKLDDADWLEAEIARLTARPYPLVGVPMYLAAEDLTEDAPPATATADADRLAQAFDRAVQTLEARRGGRLGPQDVAHVVEVLAEHSFLDRPFSQLAGTDVTAAPDR